MNRSVTLNVEQRLYVIPCGEGYTCLGFDVCEQWAQPLDKELQDAIPPHGSINLELRKELEWPLRREPSLEVYEHYRRIVDVARRWNAISGWRSSTQLTSQLIGLEYRHVEVVDCYGKKKRFRVGRSTGFIPCHLEIKPKILHEGKWILQWEDDDGIGGCSVGGTPFTSLKVLRGNRFVSV